MACSLDGDLLEALRALDSAIRRVDRITRALELRDILESELLQLGVTKAVEQVGEISGRVLRKFPSFAVDHPALELKPAYDARNRLSHGYDTLDFEAVWLTATVSVPRMGRVLADILSGSHDRP